jgi:hypothetical protein
MLDRLTVADFEPLCGSAFRAELPGAGPLELGLLSATAFPAPLSRTSAEPPTGPGGADGRVRRQPFSLVFRVRTSLHLPQGTYPLAHDRLGRLDIFLVPVGRDADGLLLEAIFA